MSPGGNLSPEGNPPRVPRAPQGHSVGGPKLLHPVFLAPDLQQSQVDLLVVLVAQHEHSLGVVPSPPQVEVVDFDSSAQVAAGHLAGPPVPSPHVVAHPVRDGPSHLPSGPLSEVQHFHVAASLLQLRGAHLHGSPRGLLACAATFRAHVQVDPAGAGGQAPASRAALPLPPAPSSRCSPSPGAIDPATAQPSRPAVPLSPPQPPSSRCSPSQGALEVSDRPPPRSHPHPHHPHTPMHANTPAAPPGPPPTRRP